MRSQRFKRIEELEGDRLGGGGAIPPRLQPPADLLAVAPAGFWRRLVATFIDKMILTCLSAPFYLIALFMFGISALKSQHAGDFEFTEPHYFAHAFFCLLSLGVAFFYYGWFYKHKGASPGKLVLNLIVVDGDTGANLGYWRSFGRETVGKFISALVLMGGFIMVGLRRDKKGLHDFIFNTQVIYRK